jgi:predicted nucleic-acid-binding protein
MIALDTNILVRLITRGNEEQALRAKSIFDLHRNDDGALFVSDIVLVELCWTLERSYRLTRQEIESVLLSLLDNSTVQLESPALVRDAIGSFRTDGVGFSDCLIVARAHYEGCTKTLTFDRRMSSLPNVEVL